jgi:hypothetical protein
VFNPGIEPKKLYDIDRIVMGFEQGVWRIRLEKEHSMCGEIRFNAKKDVINLWKWLNDKVY